LGNSPKILGPIEISHSHPDLSSTKEVANLFITIEQIRCPLFFDDLAGGQG